MRVVVQVTTYLNSLNGILYKKSGASSVVSKIVKTSKKGVCSKDMLEQTPFLDVFTILLASLLAMHVVGVSRSEVEEAR